MTSWQSGRKWHVNDIKNLNGKSAKWYTPMRMLDLSVEEYISLLLKYKAKGIHYYAPSDYLGFYFLTEGDANRFCAFINAKAKQKQFYCL